MSFPGYLQEEGLSATSQAFIHESPNLKEYADHTLGDGAIPACVFVSVPFCLTGPLGNCWVNVMRRNVKNAFMIRCFCSHTVCLWQRPNNHPK